MLVLGMGVTTFRMGADDTVLANDVAAEVVVTAGEELQLAERGIFFFADAIGGCFFLLLVFDCNNKDGKSWSVTVPAPCCVVRPTRRIVSCDVHPIESRC